MDRVDEQLAAIERQIERASLRIDREGSVADATLLIAVSGLLEAVRELAKRNDPLAAEKAEAAFFAAQETTA